MTERVFADRRERLGVAAQLRVVMYLRVSKPGDKSITDQEKVGRRDIAEFGGVVVAVFKDKQSASRYRKVQDRPDFDAMKDYVRAGGADMLWTFAHNRSHRDLDDYVPLRRLCIETKTLWRYGGKTHDLSASADRRAANADALRAEEYGDEQSENIKRGTAEALENGEAHGKVPRGYRIIRDPHTGKPIRREPIPAQARVLKKAAKLLLDPVAPQSVYAVVRDLAPKWYAAGGKGTFEQRTLRALLINPTYAGMRTSNGEIVRKGTWAPIFTMDQHLALKALLTDPKRKNHRGTAPVHLCSWIAECGVCKGRVSPKNPPSTRPRSSPTYRCPDGHVSMSRKRVDDHVEEVLAQLFERPETAKKLAAADDNDEASIEQEWARIDELRAEVQAFTAEAAKTRMSATAVAAYVVPLEDEIREGEQRVEAMMAQIDPTLADAARPGFRQRWISGEYSILRKREILRASAVVTIYPADRPTRITVRPIGKLR